MGDNKDSKKYRVNSVKKKNRKLECLRAKCLREKGLFPILINENGKYKFLYAAGVGKTEAEEIVKRINDLEVMAEILVDETNYDIEFPFVGENWI